MHNTLSSLSSPVGDNKTKHPLQKSLCKCISRTRFTCLRLLKAMGSVSVWSLYQIAPTLGVYVKSKISTYQRL